MVDGTLLSVRLNLWLFLDAVCRRKLDYRSLLWIDALCIDQSSIEEKNHQVQQIGKIHSKAKQVIVWPGEKTSGAD